MRIDVHQHLWPEPLLAALAGRRSAPRLARDGGEWLLELPGGVPAPLDRAAHDPGRRAELLRADGVDRALLVLAGLGAEALPAAEAEPLIDSFHAGAAALGAPFGAWAATAGGEADAPRLDAALDDGLVGLCLPAEALASAAAAARQGPLLELLAARERPLLVHPGTAPAEPSAPRWFSALTAEVAALQRAWHVVHAHVLPAVAGLRVCFTALAGSAPLNAERLAAHGGGPQISASVFVETSSYGVRAVDACVRALGVDALVYGSDRPLLEPQPVELGDALDHALAVANPARLLHPSEVLA